MDSMARFLLAALLVPSLAAAQHNVIEISGATFRPMPIALPLPATGDDMAKRALTEFDAALWFDLSACGLFRVLDRKSYLAPPTEGQTAAAIAFSKWADVGAESLVKVQLSGADDGLKGELRLFGVAAGREDFKANESAPAKDVRRLAHKLANALYKYLTHETGPFETRLAFSRKSPSGRDIWVTDWDGRNGERITNGDVNVIPALIPGDGVAFTSYRQKKPWLFTSKGRGDASLLVGKGNMVTGASWTHDGKRLAVSISEGEAAEIWVGNGDGTNLTKATDTKFFLNTSPSWSPDGRRIAFVSNRGGTPQIYVMNADGGSPRRLTFQGNYNTTPAWSPRGDVVAFTARDERNAFDLFTVNVETGKVLRLTQDAANNEEPAFSPNGRLITFISTRGGSRQPYVMTFDGNNQVALPVEPGDYATPDWGP